MKQCLSILFVFLLIPLLGIQQKIYAQTCTPLTGTYTINKNAPASSTNYQSVSAAVQALTQCTVGGAVTFNVVAATGPYNEQVVVPAITGTSATNTVTFNGNGNTINAIPGTNKGVITFNGADYVKFDNFVLTVDAGASSGWGAQFLNASDNNTLSNNTINVPQTTSTNYLGIATGTTYSTYGNHGNFNKIQNNTINGGYYGIRWNGTSTSVKAQGNEFTGNQIKDFYYYGLYLYYSKNFKVEGNDISRPTRSDAGTMYGMYLYYAESINVNKNRIHNTHGGASSLTGTIYGIYMSASDSPTGSESIFSNNLLYDFNNTGTVYAMYNSGSAGVYYFHNTWNLERGSNATGLIRGFYQTGAATNIKFNNNIIVLNDAGSGIKYAMYFGTTTSSISSNRNVLYLGTNSNNGYIGYYSGNQATLADWKTVNGSAYDQNSISVDPVFVNPGLGNLLPSNAAVNNIGAPVTPPVTTDITGATRNVTTPDPGAYEFTPVLNDVGVTEIIAPISGCGLGATEIVTVKIRNFGLDPQSNFPVQFTVNGTTFGPNTYTGTIAPGQEVTYSFTTTANLAANATYTLTATTNLATDQNNSNNTTTGYTVVSIPSITLNAGNPIYTQDFENNTHGWLAGGSNSSWALGSPSKTVINSTASGNNSWVTNLTGTYNANENSYVKSPCFNLSAFGAPVIEMKVWWNSEFSNDGAVLEASLDGGATWSVVGSFPDATDPLNWYNDNTISGAPGDQMAANAVGWTGRNTTSNGSGGWLLAKHDLTGLGGKSSVILRIAFGSSAATQDDGFAFDDVRIYDRPAKDISMLRIVQPVSGCGLSNCEMVAVEIKNEGSQPQVNIPLYYSVNNGTPVLGTYPDTLQPGQSDFFVFPTCVNLSARNLFVFEAWSALAGEATINRPNDSVGGYEVSNLLVKPTNTTPYVQDFEQNRGGWESYGANSTWAFGTPSKIFISRAASGNNAWVTGGLGSGSYNPSEGSYVLSPCMDFTALTTPVLEMNVWWNSQFNKDGAAIQSSIDGGTTWQTVGSVGPDWYNSAAIAGNPGAQTQGWSGSGPVGTAGASSGGWVSVREVMTQLAGKSSVYLRVVFGADATTQMDGFAFDDVKIYNRPNYDLAVQSIMPVAQNCGLSACEKIRVKLKNYGLNQISTFSLTYTINGNSPVTQTFTLPLNNELNPGEDRIFEFTTCANLANPGSYLINVTANYAQDQLNINNSTSMTLFNSLYTTLPVGIMFEAGASTISQLSTSTNSESSISVTPTAANNSQFGLLMEGGASTPWTDPIGFNTPWNTNPDHVSVATICVKPTQAIDSLVLSFDLKQIYKGLFSNTAFRITVNGAQIDSTFFPPVTGPSTAYTTFELDLSSYIASNLANQQVIRIGFESNVREKYNGGNGNANFLDNIFIKGYLNGVMVGVKDNFAQGIAVYPNPSSDVFKVEVENSKNYTVEVIDLSGRLIRKMNGKGTGTTLLDMSNQAKGIYLMRIVSQEGKVATRKLVLQ